MSVLPGIEVLCKQRAELVRGKRVALLAHPASVGRDLRHAIDWLRDDAGAHVERVLAPEHGTGGGHQDMATVAETFDPLLGAPVISLYGANEASLTLPKAALSGIDLVVADLMDVGARYYTFYATIVRALAVCGEAGVPLVVCDRPNPLGGVVIEGNVVQPAYHSFVSELSVPQRHGLTIAELCRLAVRDRRIDVELIAIPCRGWQRQQWWNETGLPWVPPSPNMPTLETAVVYPGGCLVEATNLSEGRGTTRPFEWIGAPWLDARPLAAALQRQGLSGVTFRAAQFRPAFQKHRGVECYGVFLHVTDRSAFTSTLAGIAVLIEAHRLSGGKFGWRTEPYEFVSDRPAIDLLMGGPEAREAIEAGAEARQIAAAWPPAEAEFRERRRGILIYPD